MKKNKRSISELKAYLSIASDKEIIAQMVEQARTVRLMSRPLTSESTYAYWFHKEWGPLPRHTEGLDPIHVDLNKPFDSSS